MAFSGKYLEIKTDIGIHQVELYTSKSDLIGQSDKVFTCIKDGQTLYAQTVPSSFYHSNLKYKAHANPSALKIRGNPCTAGVQNIEDYYLITQSYNEWHSVEMIVDITSNQTVTIPASTFAKRSACLWICGGKGRDTSAGRGGYGTYITFIVPKGCPDVVITASFDATAENGTSGQTVSIRDYDCVADDAASGYSHCEAKTNYGYGKAGGACGKNAHATIRIGSKSFSFHGYGGGGAGGAGGRTGGYQSCSRVTQSPNQGCNMGGYQTVTGANGIGGRSAYGNYAGGTTGGDASVGANNVGTPYSSYGHSAHVCLGVFND